MAGRRGVEGCGVGKRRWLWKLGPLGLCAARCCLGQGAETGELAALSTTFSGPKLHVLHKAAIEKYKHGRDTALRRGCPKPTVSEDLGNHPQVPTVPAVLGATARSLRPSLPGAMAWVSGCCSPEPLSFLHPSLSFRGKMRAPLPQKTLEVYFPYHLTPTQGQYIKAEWLQVHPASIASVTDAKTQCSPEPDLPLDQHLPPPLKQKEERSWCQKDSNFAYWSDSEPPRKVPAPVGPLPPPSCPRVLQGFPKTLGAIATEL